MIILSCGHEDKIRHSGFVIHSLYVNEFGNLALLTENLCSDCTIKEIKENTLNVFFDWKDACEELAILQELNTLE